MQTPGPYDACPCGSGKKYKWCCQSLDGAARAAAKPDKEPDFITELRSDVNDAVDNLLQQIESGAGRQVEAELKSLFEKHPRYHMTNYAMGVWHAFVHKDAARAIPYFEAAVKIFPLFAEAHFNLGMASRQLADIPKAVESFRAAGRYSRDDDDIAELARKELRLLEDLLLKNSPLKSLDAFVANARLFQSAFDALKARQFHRAIQLFQRVLNECPGHVQSHGNLALAHAGLGQRAAALACFHRALELDPAYEPARKNERIIARMCEGQPFVSDILEIDFYAAKNRQSSE